MSAGWKHKKKKTVYETLTGADQKVTHCQKSKQVMITESVNHGN